MTRATIGVLMLVAGACTGEILPIGAGGGADVDPLAPDAAARPDADPAAPDAAPPGPDANLTRRAEVCARWNQDRVDLSEGTWSGSVAACEAGDVSAAARANALRQVNLYRFLAALPPVDHSAANDAAAQQCALMMHANGGLSHQPPASWTCYSQEGAGAAGRSNIATTAGVRAIDLYMNDHGNGTTMGHRRWILSNRLGPIGLGTTSSYSCLWVIGGAPIADRRWTAFPPPGPFPIQAVAPFFYSLDDSGWSIQSDAIDLRNAGVTVTANGQTLPVTVTALAAGYGSSYGIAFVPQGWTSQAGTTYHVEVTGIAEPIAYDVDVVDCAL